MQATVEVNPLQSCIKGLARSAAIAFAVCASTAWAAPPPPSYNPTSSDANGNTAGGTNALPELAGRDNTAFGHGALQVNSTGANNSALGAEALLFNTEGYNLTATGAFALTNNTTGHDNTANGYNSMLANTTGSFNVGVGSGTLRGNTTGSRNTAVGRAAMRTVTTGNNNIAIGYGAGEGMAGSSSNNIYLGNTGRPESGVMRLGAAGQSATFIAGIRGTAVTGGATVTIDANGQLGTLVSSARYKKDIRDIGDEDAKLLKLRPVTYTYKSDSAATKQYGLIAEEVEQVYPELVVRNADNTPESVQYHELIPMLLKQVQQQHAEIAEMKAELARIKANQPANLASR